jgi:transcriptional regulator NrdR family protein
MSTLLACHRCGVCLSLVIETRHSKRHAGAVRRRRRCKSCGLRFTTIEAFKNEVSYPPNLDARLYRERWERERSHG